MSDDDDLVAFEKMTAIHLGDVGLVSEMSPTALTSTPNSGQGKPKAKAGKRAGASPVPSLSPRPVAVQTTVAPLKRAGSAQRPQLALKLGPAAESSSQKSPRGSPSPRSMLPQSPMRRQMRRMNSSGSLSRSTSSKLALRLGSLTSLNSSSTEDLVTMSARGSRPDLLSSHMRGAVSARGPRPADDDLLRMALPSVSPSKVVEEERDQLLREKRVKDRMMADLLEENDDLQRKLRNRGASDAALGEAPADAPAKKTKSDKKSKRVSELEAVVAKQRSKLELLAKVFNAVCDPEQRIGDVHSQRVLRKDVDNVLHKIKSIDKELIKLRLLAPHAVLSAPGRRAKPRRRKSTMHDAGAGPAAGMGVGAGGAGDKGGSKLHRRRMNAMTINPGAAAGEGKGKAGKAAGRSTTSKGDIAKGKPVGKSTSKGDINKQGDTQATPKRHKRRSSRDGIKAVESRIDTGIRHKRRPSRDATSGATAAAAAAAAAGDAGAGGNVGSVPTSPSMLKPPSRRTGSTGGGGGGGGGGSAEKPKRILRKSSMNLQRKAKKEKKEKSSLQKRRSKTLGALPKTHVADKIRRREAVKRSKKRSGSVSEEGGK